VMSSSTSFDPFAGAAFCTATARDRSLPPSRTNARVSQASCDGELIFG
jgi:hypothetical protein